MMTRASAGRPAGLGSCLHRRGIELDVNPARCNCKKPDCIRCCPSHLSSVSVLCDAADIPSSSGLIQGGREGGVQAGYRITVPRTETDDLFQEQLVHTPDTCHLTRFRYLFAERNSAPRQHVVVFVTPSTVSAWCLSLRYYYSVPCRRRLSKLPVIVSCRLLYSEETPTHAGRPTS